MGRFIFTFSSPFTTSQTFLGKTIELENNAQFLEKIFSPYFAPHLSTVNLDGFFCTYFFINSSQSRFEFLAANHD